ncbi:MAG: RMD1 family protein [Parachlamydiaceae bacterium]|nr:RMD1 family protein [Parachlamydiaceae bacterium]
MDCRAYCTASAYHIKQIYDYFKNLDLNPVLYRDVVHLPVQNSSVGDIFFFSYGAAVFWGLTEIEEKEFLSKIKKFEETHLDQWDTDLFTYVYGETPKIVDDEIILPNREVVTKLAVSHGLAQSVKLGTFENAIRKSFNHTKHIPNDLASHGRIGLSRKEIRRKMGELFIERSSVNLHVDVLDTPEFFWEYCELEPLYSMTANYLDVETRVEVLNQRLDVMHELFDMLGTELHHQHSSRLEWTIIILIVTEVILTLLRDVFRVI